MQGPARGGRAARRLFSGRHPDTHVAAALREGPWPLDPDAAALARRPEERAGMRQPGSGAPEVTARG
eukprot:2442813-Lingulodinium_polyedra.AAC.1